MQSSDVSLCVLSAPDVLVRSRDSGWELSVPPTITPLVKDDTYILLNKVDLLPPSALANLPSRATWAVSLSTGHGTQAFMESFAQALQQRFGCSSFACRAVADLHVGTICSQSPAV